MMKRRFALGALASSLAMGPGFWLAGGSLGQTRGAALAQEAEEIDTSSIVEMTLGSPDAKVEFIEYASYTCPHCARFHSDQFKQLKAEYIDTGKVHFIYRDVYFDRFGLWAAIMARCGGKERFFGITDLLYAQQDQWLANRGDPAAVADSLRQIGKVAGIGSDDLEACFSDADRAQTLVAWYRNNAEADQVEGTPTLLINGRKYSNMSYADIKEILDDLLEE